MIYPEMRGDYFSNLWSQAEYASQVNILLDNDSDIAITDKGFIRINHIQKIIEIFKGFLGGTNRTQKERIEAAWLKFLYYGEAHGYLNNQLKPLKNRVSQIANLDPIVQDFINIIEKGHNKQIPTSTQLERLRNIISNFHSRNESNLKPGFWTRIVSPPMIDSKKLLHFGDTAIQLSVLALIQGICPDYQKALFYLQKAFAVKNDSVDFQKNLILQLETLSSC